MVVLPTTEIIEPKLLTITKFSLKWYKLTVKPDTEQFFMIF